MSRKAGLLADIQAGAVDDSVSLESLLQKCIALGGQAGSVKLRDWARQELNGYSGEAELPVYRRVSAQLYVRITNRVGINAITQEIYAHMFPKQIQETLPPLDKLELRQGVGELEATARANDKNTVYAPFWAPALIDYLNEHHMDDNSVAAQIYWPLRGCLNTRNPLGSNRFT